MRSECVAAGSGKANLVHVFCVGVKYCILRWFVVAAASVSNLLQRMVVFILQTAAAPQIVDSAFERRRRLELRSNPSQVRRCHKDVKIRQD